MKLSFPKVTALCLSLFLLASCNSKNKEVPVFNKSYAAYVGSFTSGVVSKKATIRVGFSQSVSKKLTEGVLRFKPQIEGELKWVNNQTLEFTPAENLKPGEIYVADLDLSRIMEVPDSLKLFEFGFQVIHTSFEWGSIQLKAEPNNQMQWYTLEGSLLAADEEELDYFEEILRVKVDGRSLQPEWSKGSGLRTYRFELDSIERKEETEELLLQINTSIQGVENLKNQKLELPGLGDFRYMGMDLISSPTRTVVLKFSDPIQADQNLSGLITLEDVNDLKYKVDNTSILVYPPDDLFGEKKLQIFKGIKNILGYRFEEEKEVAIQFKNEKPQIRFLGNGNVLPTSENLLLPFEAISLKAADVKVIKIAEKNVLQFMQVNQLNGSSELHRVGEVVAEKKIDLLQGKNTVGSDWQTYSLDLSTLINPEPGAIYRVYLTFKQSYSDYLCIEDLEKEIDDDYEDEYYWYDYEYDRYGSGNYGVYNWGDYYTSYPRGYRWRERDNPCHVSYYRNDNFVTRNILASNLGLIAKRGNNNKLDVTVTNLKTAKAADGATLRLYNYQQRLIAEFKTDGKGWAEYELKESAYFLVAEKNGQKAYLKLDDALSLSVSNFQVSGNRVQDGIKGFIYGERGVWRPGDSIFLNFILEDGLQTLPKDHPIHFELRNPEGQIVDRQITNTAEGFIRNFKTRTKPTDLTGNYEAIVRIGGVRFNKRIRVETVKPNRLDIEMEFEEKTILLKNKVAEADLKIKWLTGVEASKAKVKITANLAKLNTPFGKYSDYNFNDPYRNFELENVEFFEGNMNEFGEGTASGELGSFTSAPGMLKARFLVKAFEGGGDFSTEYFDANVSPFERYVGIKIPKPKSGYYLTTNEEHSIQIRTVDHLGKPVNAENLEVKVYKIGWNWWYNSNGNRLAKYINNESTYMVAHSTVSTKSGLGQYKLNIKHPSWGRYLIRITDGKGHSTGKVVYIDWPQEQRKNRSQTEGESFLNITSDKEEYNVGDKVSVKIPTAESSRVLLTLENGTEILKKDWVESAGSETSYTFTVTEEMAPNIYVSAMLIQPHAQTENNRPMRLYGIIPISIKDQKTILKPVIKSKDVWRPETEVSVEVSEEQGKEMYYTLAIVDEGLLNLTQFKTPKPWPVFYAKEALGVKSWDMFNSVIGAFTGELAQVYAIGGDGALSKKGLNNQNRFKPMVKHLGPFKLKKGDKAMHKVQLPNYIGKVRIMVVAANPNKAYGHADKSVQVRKPLMVLSTLPRVTSPKEKITLPVTVFAMEDKVREVEVEVKTEGKIRVVGDTKKTVKFSKNGEKVVDFELETPSEIGSAKVMVSVKGGGEKAYDNTELMVRLPNPPITYAEELYLKPGADTVISYIPIGVATTNRLLVESYGIPPINLEKRLKYLTAYPHGCTEQIVSRVFPLLYLDGVMDLDDDFKNTNNENIRIAVQSIYERQRSNGSFRYWPSSSRDYDYLSTYAGQFVYQAKQKGYDIPEGMISRWEKYQKNKSRNWRPLYNSSGNCYNCFEQAYRLYTLAEIGKPEIGAMNRLKETDRGVPDIAKWNLAGAYLLAGQDRVGREIAMAVYKEPANSETRYWYYGSNLRDEAMKLEVLNKLGEEGEALKMARLISKKLTSSSWYTTHSVAFALKSMMTVYGTKTKDQQMAWEVSSTGGESKRYADSRSIERFKFSKNRDKTMSLTLKNTGTAPLNFSVVSSGIPIEHDVPATSHNLDLNVNYMYPNGDPIDVSSIKQGQDFMVDITIYKTKGTLGCDNMALSQLFPAGWEIINTRLFEMAEANDSKLTTPDYQDIRDDRVYTYFNLRVQQKVKFRVRLNATYAGKYFLPPVYVEDMYNAETKAQNKGQWVEVVR